MTDKQALRTDPLIANALETAKQLRELQESPVAEAIFESIVEDENGKEIQFERPISDLAFAATWQLEKLVVALEAAEHTAAVDHEAACSLVEENEEVKRKLVAAEKRIAELEAREFPGGFTFEEAKELHANLVRSHISKAISSEKMNKSARDTDLAWIKEQLISAAWFVQASIDRAAGIGKGE